MRVDYCAHCRERLVAGDHVVVMNNGDMIMHRNCALRGVIGSASHVLRICSCYIPGSEEGDPPELSTRQAANLAVELWNYEHRKACDSFEVAADESWIECKTCGMRSFNPHDVAHRYCGHCHKFLLQ